MRIADICGGMRVGAEPAAIVLIATPFIGEKTTPRRRHTPTLMPRPSQKRTSHRLADRDHQLNNDLKEVAEVVLEIGEGRNRHQLVHCHRNLSP